MIRIDFTDFGPYKMVGKEICTKHEEVNPVFPTAFPTIPSLWQRCFADGTFDALAAMSEHCPAETPDGYEGMLRDFNPADGAFTYVAGFLMKTTTPVPDGYAAYDMPACRIAQAWIEGEEHDIYPNAHRLTVEAVQSHGYEVDWAHYFSCEVYTEQRFGLPQRRGQKVLVLDYYMPVKPKQTAGVSST
ncbi:AraC family transcriptional regulator [Paenibacillus sp. 598K]|nr:AraC family transcriptional regulator [Paenibacillus sp. 598K]